MGSSSSANTAQEQLLATNEEFRRLKEDHSRYDEHLSRLTGRHVQTEKEKVEEKRLKKLKLQLKDRMESIVRDYQHQMSH